MAHSFQFARRTKAKHSLPEWAKHHEQKEHERADDHAYRVLMELKQFMLGNGALSANVLEGLHKHVGVPTMINKLIEAHKMGARMGTDVPGCERLQLVQLIRHAAFDWGDAVGESRRHPNAAASKALSPKTRMQFEQAKQTHQASLQHVWGMLARGREQHGTKYGETWSNTCHWFMTGKAKLKLWTSTHDARARARANGYKNQLAVFGGQHSEFSAYDPVNKLNGNNITITDGLVLGQQVSGNLSLFNSHLGSQEQLQDTLVHEVQHDADHHGKKAFERFESEFRAYWLEGMFQEFPADVGTARASLVTTQGLNLSGFHSARQQQIFAHLCNCGSYDYVVSEWRNSAAFRAYVRAYTQPKGVNMVNSPRLDALYVALQGGQIDRARRLVSDLPAADREALHIPSMHDTWLRVIEGLDDFSQRYFLLMLGFTAEHQAWEKDLKKAS